MMESNSTRVVERRIGGHECRCLPVSKYGFDGETAGTPLLLIRESAYRRILGQIVTAIGVSKSLDIFSSDAGTRGL